MGIASLHPSYALSARPSAACLPASPAIGPSGRTTQRHPIARCAFWAARQSACRGSPSAAGCVFAFARGDDVRSALRAEIPGLARRGFKTPQQAFALDPAKPVARHVGHRREGRAVGLAARGAVAMHDRPGIGIDFVSHVSAQAASVEHGCSSSNKNPAQDIRSMGGIFVTLKNAFAYFRLAIST